MNIIARCFLACFASVVLVSCGVSKPTTEEATNAINEYFTTSGATQAQVVILRFGDRGTADFAAPGSQDAYWPVEFKRSGKEDVAKLGPLEISKSSKDQGVALIYKTKMGQWKVGRVEP